MFGLNESTQYIIEVSSFYDCTTKKCIVVQLKKLYLYDYRVYSCTTKQVIAVRLKGVVTRLSRGADCSQQTC